ncbi:MAG: endonuclease/exonuclease/phosphatase family protein [Clostridia bacterium]|nr:endonuclease/exonuclease/phosphatase family protein [Clostridia bacterium]
MKIVTFNIRCSWDKDGINNFLHRAGGILQKITEEKPDAVFFQEATGKNIAFLRNFLSEYHIIFNQRDSQYKGEGLALAYRKQTTELLALNAFWLSPTPHVPGSRFEEQSPSPRICQAVTLRCEDKIFRVYNVHLDHICEAARSLAVDVVLNQIKNDNEKQPSPFFLCGDFNAEPDSEPIQRCKAFPLTDLAENVEHTFHEFGRIENPWKIDYVFTSAETASLPHTATPWTDERDGIYLSDHYPVCVELQW